MDIVNPVSFFQDFPRLSKTFDNFSVTSPATIDYNCIAWAMGDKNNWWWPDEIHYWPPKCQRANTIKAFKEGFSKLNYRPCENGNLEPGFEKVALYAINSEPTHAARQLKSGKWTSKTGKNVDIEHNLEDLEGPKYGKVVKFFRRKRK